MITSPGARGLIKRILIGRAIATEEATHQLLPKKIALPVFASDALSSNAYATEEIMHVLILAGSAALASTLPIAGAVAALLVIVIVSYRQTVRAYPRGGGSYIVARDNVGEIPGLIAAAALLTDYVLTVSVSMAAGAAAISSLVPSLLEHRVVLALSFVVLVMVANLRGARESGGLFAVPTYAFILAMLTMIVVGVGRCLVAACPKAEHLEVHEVSATVTVFLLLRAFSSGATALTGVEAIADGVPAFQGTRPSEQARNAATTLAMLGVLTVTMFVGITVLARWTDVVPSAERTVTAQIAHAVFGGGIGFGIVQIATALILILAANTAYQDFPRLSSILARDRYMPRQFMNRGDRLVFSNGVVVLSVLAAVLIYLYDAEVTRLIQLYVVGVFTSFTLSQLGMVLRWRRLKPDGWRPRAIMNAVGATTTGVVLVVVAVSKFLHGAWIVIVAVPILVLLLKAINTHYLAVGRQLRIDRERPGVVSGTRAVVLVPAVDDATMRAVGYAKAMRPLELRALHIGPRETATEITERWSRAVADIPLELMPPGGRRRDRIAEAINAIPRSADETVTAIIPEPVRSKGWRHLLSGRDTQLIKADLLFEPGIVVTDVPAPVTEAAEPPAALATVATAGPPAAVVPRRIDALVLVSGVHNATMAAVRYVQALRPATAKALSFNIEPAETERILLDWGSFGVPIPLEVIDAPFRNISRAVVRHVRKLRAADPGTVVAVILPEFVVAKWWHQPLHNQTPLAIKAALLFEEGVVVTSVPFHLR